MKPKITKRNIKLAKEVLYSAGSMSSIAAKHGIKRQTLHKTLRRFCQHFMFNHERLDSSGNVKDLKGLRRAWRMSLHC
jgi:predicted DNA-binding protein YlxM (UPF0122 family)